MRRHAAFWILALGIVVVIALLFVSEARASIRSTICSVFGPRCSQALRVAMCESRLNPRAVGRHGERGLFQIHPVHFGWLDEWRLFEPRYNARIAYRLSRGGRTWQAWTCRP